MWRRTKDQCYQRYSYSLRETIRKPLESVQLSVVLYSQADINDQIMIFSKLKVNKNFSFGAVVKKGIDSIEQSSPVLNVI